MPSYADLETHLALRSILLGVSGLPAQQAWENAAPFTPTAGVPYLEDAFVPATAKLLTTIKNGIVERTGLYRVTWYGIAGSGLTAIRNGCAAILAAFPPGLSHLMPGSGLTLRIRGDTGPWAGQLIPMDTGFAAVVVTIPWRVYDTNP